VRWRCGKHQLAYGCAIFEYVMRRGCVLERDLAANAYASPTQIRLRRESCHVLQGGRCQDFGSAAAEQDDGTHACDRPCGADNQPLAQVTVMLAFMNG